MCARTLWNSLVNIFICSRLIACGCVDSRKSGTCVTARALMTTKRKPTVAAGTPIEESDDEDAAPAAAAMPAAEHSCAQFLLVRLCLLAVWQSSAVSVICEAAMAYSMATRTFNWPDAGCRPAAVFFLNASHEALSAVLTCVSIHAAMR